MSAMQRSFGNHTGRRAVSISTRWPAITSLLVIATAVGILTACRLGDTDADRGQRELIDALSARRLIEARLSGGFKAGEFRPSPQDTSGIKTDVFERASALIMDSLARGDSSAQLPYARLLLSRNEKLPEALKYLRLVLARSPENTDAHNDLGVCFIQQGKLEDAIGEFDIALKQRNDMPEALFNRGLSYQLLLLEEAARKDFTRAAEVERDNGWLIEIRRRIEERTYSIAPQDAPQNPVAEFETAFEDGRLENAKGLAAENSESLRTHALWELTRRYLRSAADGDIKRAEHALSEIKLIGDVLNEKMGDSITRDAGEYVAGVPESARRSELDLIDEYVETSKGTRHPNKVSTVFKRLEGEFRARRNYVFEALSSFKVADQYYSSKNFKESIEKLKRLLSSTASREWPYDRARFLNELALETSRVGQDSLAIKYFQQAITLCGESPNLEFKILQYMSVPYIQLGDIERALERLRDSTKSGLQNERLPYRLSNLAYNYSQLAGIYSLRNQHSLALPYARQALSYAEEGKDFEYAAEYSSVVAIEEARLGQFDAAEANLKRALEYLASIEETKKRSLTEARVLTNGIEVAARRGDAQRALTYYTRAVDLAKLDEGNSLLKIDLLRARADADIASGQSDGARSDLLQAVLEIERYRANIATSDQRSHFLDASHDVYDQLVSLDARTLDKAPEAFEMAERSRARALLEEISNATKTAEPENVVLSSQNRRTPDSPGSVVPLSLADVQSNLPDDLTVLEYSITSERTYLFLITRSAFKVKESSATTEALQRLTGEYIGALRSVAEIKEVNEKASELYDLLIKPVESEIDGVVNLCIVPDKSLHFLPFAGLVDGSQHYLLESRRLSYAPSASVLIRCLKERQPTAGGKPENLLAVGDPKFNLESFPNLRPLEDAEREARQSARFYAPPSVTLIGAEATESRVRSAIKECDVAHLAVHCLVDERSPWLAALVLADPIANQTAQHRGDAISAAAPSANPNTRATILRSAALKRALPPEPVIDPNDGLLYLKELYGIKLSRTRLVVLSACQSGLGQFYRGEGIVSLVRPLLAAGVPTVVASLWPVDSKATSDLMIEFHKQRKLIGGMQAAEALRRAQLELARTYEHPFYWAPFIAVGGSSSAY